MNGGEVLIRPGPQRFYGPKSEVDKIAQTVGAQFNSQLKEYTVDCNQVADLPKLTFKVNGTGQLHTLTSKDYVVQVCFFTIVTDKVHQNNISGQRPATNLHSAFCPCPTKHWQLKMGLR